MKSIFTKTLLKGFELVLKSRNFAILAGLSTVIFAFVYVAVLPSVLIPGNDLAFQLRILNLQGVTLVALSSIGIGLLFAMNVYLFKVRRAAKLGVANMAAGSGLFGTSLVAGLFATAACPGCIALLFGFLGPSALFVAQNNLAFSLTGVAMTWAVVFGAAWVVGRGCDKCKIRI